MKNVWTIYRREIAAYFNSPIAYIIVVLFVMILSFIFFIINDFGGQTQPFIRGYFTLLPWVFAIFIPAVTMRLWAEEMRAGTIELLMTMPIKSWEIVVGKYLAAYTVILICLLFTLPAPLLAATAVTDVDWGALFSTYVGAAVIASVYIAFGAWISTFTHNQIVALLVSMIVLLVVSFVGFPPFTLYLNRLAGLGNFLSWFGTYYHFQEFSRGLLNPVGFIYAGSVTVFFLVLNNMFVEGRKY